jgi:hypothetical protein
MKNDLGHCHDATASCVRPTAKISCTELHHKDDGGLLGSTAYRQFGLMVCTHDAQHPSNREKQ